MADNVEPSASRVADGKTILPGVIEKNHGAGWVVQAGSQVLAAGTRQGFEVQSNSGLTVTIGPGEAFIGGNWLDRDVNSSATLAASGTGQTVYAGKDVSAKDTVIVGLAGSFAADDPKIPLYDFDTDAANVTGSVDRRNVGPHIEEADFEGSPTVRGNEIWHAGNDGSASGLDADRYKGNDIDSNGDGKVNSAVDSDKLGGTPAGTYTKGVSGGKHIYVQAGTPANPSTGDIWIQT